MHFAGSLLRLILGPSLMGCRVRVFTNSPAAGQCYDRVSYRELKWMNLSRNINDDLDAFVQITCRRAGPFRYYFLCNSE